MVSSQTPGNFGSIVVASMGKGVVDTIRQVNDFIFNTVEEDLHDIVSTLSADSTFWTVGKRVESQDEGYYSQSSASRPGTELPAIISQPVPSSTSVDGFWQNVASFLSSASDKAEARTPDLPPLQPGSGVLKSSFPRRTPESEKAIVQNLITPRDICSEGKSGGNSVSSTCASSVTEKFLRNETSSHIDIEKGIQEEKQPMDSAKEASIATDGARNTKEHHTETTRSGHQKKVSSNVIRGRVGKRHPTQRTVDRYSAECARKTKEHPTKTSRSGHQKKVPSNAVQGQAEKRYPAQRTVDRYSAECVINTKEHPTKTTRAGHQSKVSSKVVQGQVEKRYPTQRSVDRDDSVESESVDFTSLLETKQSWVDIIDSVPLNEPEHSVRKSTAKQDAKLRATENTDERVSIKTRGEDLKPSNEQTSAQEEEATPSNFRRFRLRALFGLGSHRRRKGRDDKSAQESPIPMPSGCKKNEAVTILGKESDKTAPTRSRRGSKKNKAKQSKATTLFGKETEAVTQVEQESRRMKALASKKKKNRATTLFGRWPIAGSRPEIATDTAGHSRRKRRDATTLYGKEARLLEPSGGEMRSREGKRATKTTVDAIDGPPIWIEKRSNEARAADVVAKVAETEKNNGIALFGKETATPSKNLSREEERKIDEAVAEAVALASSEERMKHDEAATVTEKTSSTSLVGHDQRDDCPNYEKETEERTESNPSIAKDCEPSVGTVDASMQPSIPTASPSTPLKTPDQSTGARISRFVIHSGTPLQAVGNCPTKTIKTRRNRLDRNATRVNGKKPRRPKLATVHEDMSLSTVHGSSKDDGSKKSFGAHPLRLSRESIRDLVGSGSTEFGLKIHRSGSDADSSRLGGGVRSFHRGTEQPEMGTAYE